MPMRYILQFKDISIKDVPLVGGKNASLGEMFSKLSDKGIRVPDGFALTSESYWHFIEKNNLKDKIKTTLNGLDISNIKDLQRRGRKIRELILSAYFPEDLAEEIKLAYKNLSAKYGKDTDVAVRSSATAEDLPTASFAGQHETYLDIRGEKNLLLAVKKCIASLFTDRAIVYREEKGFAHLKVALSAGVQKMVRSDSGSAGVMFTLDTETGFPNVVLINSVFGIGENIVQGRITPDEFYVFKPSLKQGYPAIIKKDLGEGRQKFSIQDKDVLTLAKWATAIEDHYGMPMDIEWAKDGISKELFIVQARPETVHVRKKNNIFKEYALKEKNPKLILEGIAIGSKITAGQVRVIKDIRRIEEFRNGEILVTTTTNPDW